MSADNRKPLDTSTIAYAPSNVIGRVELKGRDLENIERRRALAANKPPASFNPIRGLEKVKPSAPRVALSHSAFVAKENRRISAELPPRREANPLLLPPHALLTTETPAPTKRKRAHFGNTWTTSSAVRKMEIGGRVFLLIVARERRGPESDDVYVWCWHVAAPSGALNASTPASASGQSTNEKAAKIAAKRAAEALAKKS